MDLADRSNVFIFLAAIDCWELPLLAIGAIGGIELLLLATDVNVVIGDRLENELLLIQVEFWQVWAAWTPGGGNVCR